MGRAGRSFSAPLSETFGVLDGFLSIRGKTGGVARATFDVPEIPFQAEVCLPAAETAIVVVDMQNDFVKPEGSLRVEGALATVPRVADLLERARRAGARVAYTQDTHFEGDREWEIWPKHCESGSWGWRIVDELAPKSGDLVCLKSRYDGFYGTWLDHYLTHVWRVRHLVLAGTVSNICVLQTAASAALRWFELVVPADAISSLNDFDQTAALRQISWLYRGQLTRKALEIAFE